MSSQQEGAGAADEVGASSRRRLGVYGFAGAINGMRDTHCLARSVVAVKLSGCWVGLVSLPPPRVLKYGNRRVSRVLGPANSQQGKPSTRISAWYTPA